MVEKNLTETLLMQTTTIVEQEAIYTVSRLNNEVRFLLEGHFPTVWVEGEISNFAAPHSGHWYFSLKDASAQVRCAMFRGQQRKLPFTPSNGLHVLIKARVSLYENRGEFQLIAEEMEERGEGKLRRAFELLKQKLEAAGWFAAPRKKPLPAFPRCIGVITSATGAALRDILHVLKRRYAIAPIIIYPTLVQGEQAAPAIVKAIQTANERRECDVLLLARGGGSLEDLWPFNEESVAAAIYQSELPIVSGVGHEVDFTIADFVADVRAPTPSAAAEISTPDGAALLQHLARREQQITRLMQQKLLAITQQLAWTKKHLYQQHPKRQLAEKMQHLDFCELTLQQLQQRLLTTLQQRLQHLDAKLQRLTPLAAIQQRLNQVQTYRDLLVTKIKQVLNHRQTELANAAAKLDALSPLATLKRGYAIISTSEKPTVNSVHQVRLHHKISVRLLDGTLGCVVDTIK